MSSSNNNVKIFDTTLRDGELTPGVKMNIQDKISIAKLLEEMGVDVIEVGYPGQFEKYFDKVFNFYKIIRKSNFCGLASYKENEIIRVGKAIKPAKKGKSNTYSNVTKHQSEISKERVIETIRDSVALARNYCGDVQWSAFDATRSEPDFLCQAVEVAINSGATTVSIPDSLGVASPEEFSRLIQHIINRVPNSERAIFSVHCHDDIGMAVDNSIAALDYGVRQIECAINSLAARKGNANLEAVVMEVLKQKSYQIGINTSLIKSAS